MIPLTGYKDRDVIIFTVSTIYEYKIETKYFHKPSLNMAAQVTRYNWI